MSLKLNPYPEYKDSGLPWLGDVPEHWEIRRNGGMFAQKVETGYPELPILEVSLNTGVRVRNMDDLTRKQVMSDYGQYKRAVEGDIAYNMMRMWQGAVGRAPIDGLISPAYVVARPHHDVESRYYGYLFRTGAYMDEVNKYSRGIVSDRNRLYWEEFKQMPSAFPPPNEQRKIADLLDIHGRILQQWIQAKQWLIELLNEQKQGIIQQAVTRGLNPKVPTKRTGLDWLPEVPEHWEVTPMKRVARVSLSGVDKHSVEGEQSVLLCNYTDVYHNDFITKRIGFMPATATQVEIEAFSVQSGDVLMTKDSEVADDIAVPALVDDDFDHVLCGYHLALVRPYRSSVSGEYLFRAFSAVALSQQFHIAATGVTRFGISKPDIQDALVPLPPLEEQKEISRHISHEVGMVNNAIQRAQREIELIREYRTRLISDVVTGKLDVRDVELPDVEGESEDLPSIELEDNDTGELLTTEGVGDVNL